MKFNPGFDIQTDERSMDFKFGKDVLGPEPERRHLDDIRQSLKDPKATGPELLYSIVMDVGKKSDREDLIRRNLLYGAVQYAKGQIGDEPVRSQGHIHAISPSCGTSTPEVYEIWEGRAIVLMQEKAENQPGRVYALAANPGEIIIVPPAWAHATINADVTQNMSFGAWCVRDFGFDYRGVRAHGGLAYFPQVNAEKGLDWLANEKYQASKLIIKSPNDYSKFGLRKGLSIYQQYEENRDLFRFVTHPADFPELWENYIP